MKKSEAREILNRLLLTCQRYRSNFAMELPGEEYAEIGKELQPFALSDNYLPILIKMVDGEFTPLDFYNMITLANHAPEIQVAYSLISDEPFPEPDFTWVSKGWTT